MTPATEIDGLEIKLRQLAAKVDRQRAQYEATLAENENLKRELDRQLGVVNSLKDKLAHSQPAPEAGITPVERNDHQETIEFCLREIDRCIDWLHRN
ncbi:hypothetical protein CLV84_1983 [Neolewinella xylanilytica]|uniref:Uncharacterized protein n=1 Tax=Neolewinella xylanilytica TaxID=1514080 RepID=A0A2S6I1P3_9BACT|nr:hypothetical protein [Neolewinella xylanilytica]PPK85092.1 hypothetical protein CLV84_1983 [Neolewinella xylanilytica]